MVLFYCSLGFGRCCLFLLSCLFLFGVVFGRWDLLLFFRVGLGLFYLIFYIVEC